MPFLPSLPPIDAFPKRVWNRLLAREAARPGDTYWEYGASNGLLALRVAIAGHAAAMRATSAAPEQIIVVTSTQQALELAAKVIADPGDAAWMESPGYLPARYCLRAAGLRIVDVRVDDDGLDVDDGKAREPDARLAYVTPSHQYPLGVEMSIERRGALLSWALEHDAYVLEDDYDGDFRYEGRPIASLQGMDDGDRTIYIGSFSKITFPALRSLYMSHKAFRYRTDMERSLLLASLVAAASPVRAADNPLPSRQIAADIPYGTPLAFRPLTMDIFRPRRACGNRQPASR